MTNNDTPEVDEASTRDPHKASWKHEDELEPDGDDTAGVVIVESETLAMAYELMLKSHVRDAGGPDQVIAGWKYLASAKIERRLNLYLTLDDGISVFDGHSLGRLIFINIVEDIREGLDCTDLFWEDVIGVTIIPETCKIQIHFSIEGIPNGGNTAQPCAQH